MRYTTSTLFVAVFAAAVICWGVTRSMTRQGTATDSSAVPMSRNSLLRQFPDGATNFAWHFGGIRNPNTYYAFDLDRNSFAEWIALHPRVRKVEREWMVRVWRYDDKSEILSWLDLPDAVYYEWCDPSDGDHGENVSYDTDKGRVYYQHHTF